MRKLLMGAVVGGMVACGAVRLEAQVRFGANISWGDDTDIGLGARLAFGLGSITTKNSIEGLATFDYFFPDAFDYWELTVNGIYKFPTEISAKPYAGAGLGYGHSSLDDDLDPLASRVPYGLFRSASSAAGFGGDGSRIFLNLLGGARFGVIGSVQPFAEARLALGDGSQLVLTGGVFFGHP